MASDDTRDPKERFSSRVELYRRYRPGYPEGLIEVLRRRCGLAASWDVADVGSGTGILAGLFLKNGNRVFGVEPNGPMRAAGEETLRGYRSFVSVEGSAENTTLRGESVDLISAGQAFHWFDRERAREEFRRVLRPGGWVALVWNDRRTEATPFLRDYEDLLRRHGTDYGKVDHKNVGRPALDAFFGPGAWTLDVVENRQEFGLDGLVGRLLSSSYVPAQGEPGCQAMLEEVERIYHEHARNGAVAFEYDCQVYAGRLENP